jgi:hypothetical protein
MSLRGFPLGLVRMRKAHRGRNNRHWLGVNLMMVRKGHTTGGQEYREVIAETKVYRG